jgi:TPP-dependent pyruvate/acetoin dehydrogenase alpha subunit
VAKVEKSAPSTRAAQPLRDMLLIRHFEEKVEERFRASSCLGSST